MPQNLYKINFSAEALQLIQSYIWERRQYVQTDGKSSSTQLNNFGVPQGSILSLVLFNLYTVDIVDNISCNSLKYADDTTLYQHCKLKNQQNCIEQLESDLQTVSDWALQNSLVFNDDKTKYLLFSSIQLSKRQSLSQPDKCKLIPINEPVERLNSTKILDVYFDENLTWITHVNNLINHLMPRSEVWDDSNGSLLTKYEKHWQKLSSYQIWDIAFLYKANYQNI